MEKMRDFSVGSEKSKIGKCASCGHRLSEEGAMCWVCLFKGKKTESVVGGDQIVIYRENINRCLRINERRIDY